MSDKPRRPWFQIHLSTAIVLMFVAGGLTRANVVSYRVDISDSYGWPVPYRGELWFGVIWDYGNLALDLFAAAAILAVTTYSCEWLIRRREARAR